MFNNTSLSESLINSINTLFHRETTEERCARLLREAVDTKIKETEHFVDTFLGTEDRHIAHDVFSMIQDNAYYIIDLIRGLFSEEPYQ